MKIKIQITVESDKGQPEVVQEVEGEMTKDKWVSKKKVVLGTLEPEWRKNSTRKCYFSVCQRAL